MSWQRQPRRFPMAALEKRIFLVDDDQGLRQLLLTTLAAPEFAITQAASGEEALSLARAVQPNLIILDMHLAPEHPNGLEVWQALKADPATVGCRILMLTGSAHMEDRAAALRAGADDYLTKPFSPRALL